MTAGLHPPEKPHAAPAATEPSEDDVKNPSPLDGSAFGPESGAEGGLAVFVRRPVLALVLGLLIVVAGLAAIYGAEIRELPDVDSPVITVSTDFTGAAPETIDRELTALIEGAAARVSGVKSISSSSSFGRSRVTVEFNDSTDLNVAASDLRDAIGRVSRDMPEGAEDPRIVKADADAQPVMRLAVTSDIMSVQDMTVLVEDEVVDRLVGSGRSCRCQRLRGPRQDFPDRHQSGAHGRSRPDHCRCAQLR